MEFSMRHLLQSFCIGFSYASMGCPVVGDLMPQLLQLLSKRLSTNVASSILRIILADFRLIFGGLYTYESILPPENESKVGSKEPQNRQKIRLWTVSNQIVGRHTCCGRGDVVFHADAPIYAMR